MASKLPPPAAAPIVSAGIATPVVGAPRMSTFASLRIRDYRLLWWGMVISNIGTWMQMVAQGYLVYQLTDSPLMLGLVGFVRAVPIFTFSLFAGVVADRVDRRKLLIVTQTLAGVFALIVGKEYIANAVALQSAAFNGTGILGPSLAGLALGFIGIAPCFYINAISFVAVIIALWMMSSVPNRAMRKQTMIQNLREGFGYV